jgi:mannose/fructose/N-acetylgalactosamine-specific phosphotransferase system component IID
VNRPLSRITLLRIAGGALVLQAAFNLERRQGMGVAAALAPLASRWGDREGRRRFLLRHLETYNTNPGLAGPLLGALARLESLAAAGDVTAADRAIRLKRGMESPLAALGDTLFWSGLRPGLLAVTAALGWIAGGWAVLLFLALYNAVHLGFRVGGVFWGYGAGETLPGLLRRPVLRRLVDALPWLALIGLGSLAAIAFGPSPGPGAAGLLALILGLVLGRRGVSHGALPVGGAIIVGLILAYQFGSPVP